MNSPPTSRRDVSGSFATFGQMLLISIPFFVLTPVLASFGSLFIPGMSTAVFAADENNGRTAGDSPATLYGHLGVTLIVFNIAILVINLLFGLRARFVWIVVLAVIGGLIGFFTTVVQRGGELWMWDILPITVALAYLVAQMFTSLADRVRTRP